MWMRIYCTVILFISKIVPETYTFITDDISGHKRVIIHVPVVTRTIYKLIDKGHHKHGGEIIHHHHHGGHVSHIHKHEGEAAHKHHHVGTAGHHHKHSGIASHKHLHSGKEEHAHLHQGHTAHDHLHKGIHGHDHKHIGSFTSSHVHEAPMHKRYPTVHEAFAAYGINPVEYLGLRLNNPQSQTQQQIKQLQELQHTSHQTDWMAFQPPNIIYPSHPLYAPGFIPKYSPLATFYHHEDYDLKTPFPSMKPIRYASEPENNYSNVKSQSGVTTYSGQNLKQMVNPEYEEQPKDSKKYQKPIRTKFQDEFTPSLTDDIEDIMSTSHDFDDFGESLEDDTISTSAPEDGQEMVGFNEATSGESEEGSQGAFQSHVPTKVPFLKRKIKTPYIMPVVLPYEVTEATPFY